MSSDSCQGIEYKFLKTLYNPGELLLGDGPIIVLLAFKYNKELIIKDTWLDDPAMAEVHMMLKVKGIKGVIQLVDLEVFTGSATKLIREGEFNLLSPTASLPLLLG